jgi:hypothetical protein
VGEVWWVRVNGTENVVGLRVRQHEARGGFGGQTREFVTQFWVCRTKQQWAVVMGGGGCGLMARRWRGGCKFANARPEGGSGQNPKRAFVARFRACCEKQRWQVMLGGNGCGLKAQR